MKKWKKMGRPYLLFLMAVAIAAAAGCAAAGDAEPSAEPASSPESGATLTRDGSGLSTVVVTQEPTATPEENEGENDADDAQPALEVVTPVIVDLDQITAEASSAGDSPQEMPQPGLPEPAAAASSKAAVAFADRLGIDASDVQIASLEEVEWSDSSLGCPKGGQSYLTVMTPGYRIVVEANGERAEYHADRRGRVVFCEGDN